MIKKNNSFRRNRSKIQNKNGINGFDNKTLKQKPRGNPLEIKTKYENLAKIGDIKEITKYLRSTTYSLDPHLKNNFAVE